MTAAACGRGPCGPVLRGRSRDGAGVFSGACPPAAGCALSADGVFTATCVCHTADGSLELGVRSRYPGSSHRPHGRSRSGMGLRGLRPRRCLRVGGGPRPPVLTSAFPVSRYESSMSSFWFLSLPVMGSVRQPTASLGRGSAELTAGEPRCLAPGGRGCLCPEEPTFPYAPHSRQPWAT